MWYATESVLLLEETKKIWNRTQNFTVILLLLHIKKIGSPCSVLDHISFFKKVGVNMGILLCTTGNQSHNKIRQEQVSLNRSQILFCSGIYFTYVHNRGKIYFVLIFITLNTTVFHLSMSLSHINSVHRLLSYFNRTIFEISLLCIPSSSKWFLSPQTINFNSAEAGVLFVIN